MARLGVTDKDSANLVQRLLPLTEEQRQQGGEKFLYLNPAQLITYNFGARETSIRGGRGIGKTTIIALRYLNCAQSIPRGTGLFLGNSIKQLYTKTVPSMVKSIEQLTGLKEGIHFVRGHAPKNMNFKEPLTKPRVWENVIHFYNGNVCFLISMEVRASANSFNAAYLLSDETRYLPWAKVKEEVLPALRGGVFDHPGWKEELNPYYLSSFFVSDAAITVKQAEWEKEEEHQTEKINERIASMLAELNVCPELAYAEKFIRRLNKLRCHSRAFFNFSSIENIEILGESYIRKLKRQMPPLLFNIQIMGQKKGVSKDGYYCNFDIDVHGYTAREADQTNALYNKFSKKFVSQMYDGGSTRRVEYETIDLEETGKIKNCVLDTDCLPGQPLRIAFDYGANLSAVVTGQTYRMDGTESLVILSSMYVANERKLRALCGDWCRYYEPHRQTCNDVFYYYDATAKQGGSYATENAEETKFYYVVTEELKKRGWNVRPVEMGRPMAHNQKYQFINDVLIGRQKPFLRVNKEMNDYLIVAMENARVKMGRNGFEKDKSQEKYQSEDGVAGPRETRTDITDALDTLLIGVRYFNTRNFFFSLPSNF